MAEKKEKSKLLGNIASLGIVNIANYLFPIITVPIVARALGPEKIGVINYTSSFISYFSLLVAYSFNTTGVRRIAKAPNDGKLLNETFSLIFIAQLLLFIVSSIAFAICLYNIRQLKQEFALTTITYLITVTALFTQNWVFQAKQDLKIIAVFNFIPRAVSVLFVIFLIRKPSDYIKYALILYVIPLLIALFSFFFALVKYKIRLFIPRCAIIWRAVAEDRFIFFSSVLINLYTTTGIVILGAYRNVDEVAYYTSAQKLIEIGRSIVLLPVSQSLFPLIANKFSKGLEEGKSFIKNILPIYLIASVLIMIATMALGPIVVRIMYGNKFLPSIPLLEILAIGATFVYLGVLFGHTMLSMGLDKYFFRFSFIGATLSLLFNLLFVRKIGATGTAVIWTVTELLITVYQLIVLKKNQVNIWGLLRWKDFKNLKANFKNIR